MGNYNLKIEQTEEQTVNFDQTEIISYPEVENNLEFFL